MGTDALSQGFLPAGVRNIIPTLSGVIAEKPGLFVRNTRNVINEYRQTPFEDRQELSHYVGKVLTDTWRTIRADIIYHDPIYSGSLWSLMTFTDASHPLVVGAYTGLCFTAAVAVAAALDVGAIDRKYKRQFKRWKKMGLDNESYFEARFPIIPRKDEKHDTPMNFIYNITHVTKDGLPRFNLPGTYSGTYHDQYQCDHRLEVLNNRVPKIRFRKRSGLEDEGDVQSAQIVYTRPQEIAKKERGQYKLYPIRKDKAYHMIEGPMVWTPEELENPRARKLFTKLQNGEEVREIAFDRYIAHDKDGLYVSADCASGKGGSNSPYIVEVKVREDLDLLKDAMKYIMRNYNTGQVIDGKFELLERCR